MGNLNISHFQPEVRSHFSQIEVEPKKGETIAIDLLSASSTNCQNFKKCLLEKFGKEKRIRIRFAIIYEINAEDTPSR